MLKWTPLAPEPGFNPRHCATIMPLSTQLRRWFPMHRKVWKHWVTGWICEGSWCRRSKAQLGKHCPKYLMVFSFSPKLQPLAQIFPVNSILYIVQPILYISNAPHHVLEQTHKILRGAFLLVLLFPRKSITFHTGKQVWNLGITPTSPFPLTLQSITVICHAFLLNHKTTCFLLGYYNCPSNPFFTL